MKCASERKSRKRTAAAGRMICHRILSMVLVFALLLADSSFPLLTVKAKTVTGNKLDEWTVQAEWSTMSGDYHWEAKSDTFRQPKLVITYQTSGAAKDYGPGELKITVPGIGNVNRGGTVQASQVAAAATDAEKNKYDWSYTYDKSQDLYTFVNNFTISKDQQFSGGFELLWDLQSRKSVNGYSQSEYPKFYANGKEITLPALGFSYASERDTYNLSMEAKTLGGSDWLDSDQEYVWYDIRSHFGYTRKARGLYNYEYFVALDLPAEISGENVKVEGHEVIQKDGKWGFYVYQDEYRETTDSYKDFRMGFPADEVDALMKGSDESRTVTVSGHLDRMYQDENGWTRTSIGEGDNVDASVKLVLTHYRYTTRYEGYSYNIRKSVDRYGSRSPYNSRMNVAELYGGTTRVFDISGHASRSYTIVTEQPEEAALTKESAEAPAEAADVPADAPQEGTEAVAPALPEGDAPAADGETAEPAGEGAPKSEESGDGESGTADAPDQNAGTKPDGAEEEPSGAGEQTGASEEEPKTEAGAEEASEENEANEEPEQETEAVQEPEAEEPEAESAGEEAADAQESPRAYAPMSRGFRIRTVRRLAEVPADVSGTENGTGNPADASGTENGTENPAGTAGASGTENEPENPAGTAGASGAENGTEDPVENAGTSGTENGMENPAGTAGASGSGNTAGAPAQNGGTSGAQDVPKNNAAAPSGETTEASGGAQLSEEQQTADENNTDITEAEALKVKALRAAPSGTAVGIEEGRNYSMRLYDREIKVQQNDGQMRPLTAEEYDISYVTVKAGTVSGLKYTLYGSREVNPSSDDLYEELYHGTTGSSQTFQMPAGYHAVYLAIDRGETLNGDFQWGASLGVHFQADWEVEQAKSYGERLNAEGYLQNTSVMQIYGYRQDPVGAVTYEAVPLIEEDEQPDEAYIESLSLQSEEEEILLAREVQATAEVYLRETVTDVSTQTSVQPFAQDENFRNFHTTVTSSGRIQADTSGNLSRFSLYTILPRGMSVDSGQDFTVRGTFSDIYGAEIGEDEYRSRVTYQVRKLGENTLLAADFDFSDRPLELSKETALSVEYPVYVPYNAYLEYGEPRYTEQTWLMLHDEGLTKLVNSNNTNDGLQYDMKDLDEDGVLYEWAAYSSGYADATENARDWREEAVKYVKSSFTDQLYAESPAETPSYIERYPGTENADSLYSYKMEFTLGNTPGKDVTFYDRIETGASIGTGAEAKELESTWQGDALTVDTSHAAGQGFVPTVYYATNASGEFDYTNGAVWKKAQDGGNRWTLPEGTLAVAVHLGTEKLSGNGLWEPNAEDGFRTTYVELQMRAPQVEGTDNRIGKQAVNQFAVQYESYEWNKDTQQPEPAGSTTWLSSPTSLTLTDVLGTAVLQKVDEESGNALSGAAFTIYEADGITVLECNGKRYENVSTNAFGKLELKDIPYGTYYYEETRAPRGYRKLEGKQEFILDQDEVTVKIADSRLPGGVILTKTDADDPSAVGLSGVSFELYTTSGERVFVTGSGGTYRYAAEGSRDAVSTLTTGNDGMVKVADLPWGGYYFTELEAPAGYVRYEEKAAFTIGRNQANSENTAVEAKVTVGNEEQEAVLRLTKTDADGDPKNPAGVKGAVYSLYRAKRGDETEDVLVEERLTTNAAGEIRVEGLKFGTYYFKEIMAAPGYVLTEGEETSEQVTLNAGTAGKTVDVTHSDHRKPGTLVLNKLEAGDAVHYLEGAVYELYGPDGRRVHVTKDEEQDEDGGNVYHYSPTLSSDRLVTAGEYGAFRIDGLPWGTYKLKETEAPRGYVLPEEGTAKSFSVNARTAQQEIYLELTNERQAGSARLVKADAKNSEKKLPGAGYGLYTTAGEVVSVYSVTDTDGAAVYTCRAPEGTEETAGVTEMITGEDGTFLILDIPQGGYYFMETTAPEGYSLSDEYLRFSVTTENCMTTQEIAAKDETGRGVLTITKTADEVYDGFGNPTFLFRITRQDGEKKGASYYQSITLTSGKKTGSATVTLEEGSYLVEELKTARYELSNAEGVKGNVTVQSGRKSAQVQLDAASSEAAVRFTNDLNRYDLYSHTSNLTNIVKKEKLLVGISVNYVGPTSDFEGRPGYDTVKGEYVFQNDDLEVTAFYDDGTSRKLTLGSTAGDGIYLLTPASVEADGINTSVTGTVTYTEGNVTATGYFDLTFAFPEGTKKVTLTLDLNGGRLKLPDGTVVEGEYKVKVKPGETVTLPDKSFLNAGTGREYWTALGWYKDKAGKEEIVNSLTVSEDTTVYACYEPYYDVKYAVMLCGIGADVWRDADGGEHVAGLTFGPAAGIGKARGYGYEKKELELGYEMVSDFNSIFVSHVPNGVTEQSYTLEAGGKWKTYTGGHEKRCIHNDSWSEIIKWSSLDPKVYEDCVTNRCTHSVYLDFKHTSARYLFNDSYVSSQTGDGAGTLYHSIKAEYRRWGMDNKRVAAWPESRARAVLNGSDERTDSSYAGADVDNINSNNSLLAAFPEDLQAGIKSRAVGSLENSNSGNIVYSYDKLWLLSGSEIVQDLNSSSEIKSILSESTKNSFYDVYRYPLTGKDISMNMVYVHIRNDRAGQSEVWLRSIYGQRIYCFTRAGYFRTNNADTDMGLSPCFCLE